MSWDDWTATPASPPELTRAVLERAMQQLRDQPRERPLYIVAPDRLRQGSIALAYLHGHVTHPEYRRLFHLEEWLRRGERT